MPLLLSPLLLLALPLVLLRVLLMSSLLLLAVPLVGVLLSWSPLTQRNYNLRGARNALGCMMHTIIARMRLLQRGCFVLSLILRVPLSRMLLPVSRMLPPSMRRRMPRRHGLPEDAALTARCRVPSRHTEVALLLVCCRERGSQVLPEDALSLLLLCLLLLKVRCRVRTYALPEGALSLSLLLLIRCRVHPEGVIPLPLPLIVRC